MKSASIATLIRLRFLSQLEESDDLLCKLNVLSSQPFLTASSLRHRSHGMDSNRTWSRHHRI